VSGRTLFVVLAQLLGLVVLAWVLADAVMLLGMGFPFGRWVELLPILLPFLLLSALLLCAPGLVARLFGWRAFGPADPPAVPAADSWLRVGRVAVGWYAAVEAVPPVAGFVNEIPHRSASVLLWNAVLVAAYLAFALWLLWPRRRPPIAA
jgi:hypothetical protein